MLEVGPFHREGGCGLTTRPTATGEKQRALVNRLSRPRVGANVRRYMKTNHRAIFESAIVLLLNNWRVWCGDDEIRALHIGFDSSNTEISISLLTDREPYLEEQGLDPLGDRWSVADWRLTRINDEWSSRDMDELLEWMKEKAKTLDDDQLMLFNRDLKSILFSVATSESISAQLARFRGLRKPLPVRVEWFFDNEPLDGEIR